MEEALQELGLSPKATTGSGSRTVIANRVEWMGTLNNIAELRKAIKIAFAKKSKAKDKPDTFKKYEAEIKAGQTRLNGLLAEVNQAKDPIAKAVELGEEPTGVVQLVLDHYEGIIDKELKELKDSKKLTDKGLKDLVNNMTRDIPEEIKVRLESLGEEYLEVYNSRANRGDQRVLTVNKRLNFVRAQVADEPKNDQAPAENPPEENKDQAPADNSQADNKTEQKKAKKDKKGQK